MSKKRINKKKIKQVASRARRSCRTKSNTPEELRPDNVTTTGLQYPVTLPDRIELEFSTERPDVLKRNAVERAKKVDLKEEIKGIVQAFRTDIDERLKGLSDQIENQMKPLVQAVASIAVAKKELMDSLNDFHGNLSATLSLDDELEPIEIEGMFTSDATSDETVTPGLTSDKDDEDEIGILAEATENAAPQRRSLDSGPIEEETVN